MNKILIVDDVPINIKLIRKILEREHCFEISSALNGGETLLMVQENPPDLILLDEMMPDINGVQVTKIIRETYANLDMPIIMITASTDQETKIRALEVGVDEFLSKPIDGIELLTRIRILLKNKDLYIELQKEHMEIIRQMDLEELRQEELRITAMREHEALQMFKKLFDNNPAIMAMSTLQENVFTDVNATFIEKIGYTKEEVIGKTLTDMGLFLDIEKQIVITEKLKKMGTIRNEELKVRCKNGEILDGLYWGEVIENQGIKYFLTVLVDITNQKNYKINMRAKEKGY